MKIGDDLFEKEDKYIIEEILESSQKSKLLIKNSSSNEKKTLLICNISKIPICKLAQFKSTYLTARSSHLVNYIIHENKNKELQILSQYYPYSLQNLPPNISESSSTITIETILKDILNGLTELNEFGIYHGSLNLENIVFNSYNNNTNCLLSNYYQNIILNPLENEILDNYRYYPPEVYKSEEISIKSDIWSYGCILYYLLTNKHCINGINKEEIKLNVIYFEYNNNNMLKCVNNEESIMINELLDEIFQINKNKRINLNEINDRLNRIEMKSHLLSQSLKVICKVVDKESNEYSFLKELNQVVNDKKRIEEENHKLLLEKNELYNKYNYLESKYNQEKNALYIKIEEEKEKNKIIEIENKKLIDENNELIKQNKLVQSQLESKEKEFKWKIIEYTMVKKNDEKEINKLNEKLKEEEKIIEKLKEEIKSKKEK